MQYKFKCPECDNEELREIPMAHYDTESKRQMCSKCKATMKRVIEFSGMVGSTGGYDSVVGNAKWQG